MPMVYVISSDDDDGDDEEEEVIVVEEEKEDVLPKTTDFDWLQKLLYTPDQESDDSDEVVIIHENKPALKSNSSTLPVKDIDGGGGDDGGDDCVVLEGDPENVVVSVVEEATGSDELLVVGEKGQIACRDYPHARHLCAKFPFSSTPHEKHCSQCHCYVCDCLAPCVKWGTGILGSDHCHANDRTEMWKIQRKNFKLGKSSPLPASTNFDISLRAVRPQHNLPLGIVHLSPNSVLQNQTSGSTAMHSLPSLNSISQIQTWSAITRVCSNPSLNSNVQNKVTIASTATNLTIPNGVNHSRQESWSPTVRNRYQPQSVPRQVLGVRSHAIQRDRGNGANSLRPQGVGSAGNTLTVNNSSHGSSGFNDHVNATLQHDKYLKPTGLLNYGLCNAPEVVRHPSHLPFGSLPSSEPVSLNCVDQHTVASEMQAYWQPLPQSNDYQNFHQTSIQGNDAPSSYVACLNSAQHRNERQIISQNEHARGNITQCGIASQDASKPKPHEECPRETAAGNSPFDSSWTENTGQSIEPLVEFPSLESLVSVQQPLNVKESDTQLTGSNEPPTESSHVPSSLVDFENWLLEKDSAPMVTNDIFSSDFNIPSPDFDPVDVGALYYLDEG
ncbi:hypothetical protein RJT34_22478 [Clitoria ternatea]|uniref:Uncharacterized protein n=1 Tax=Clitoria ternatea TaxID=43366 RepID=A0AAN9IHI9_CLITE